MKSFLLAFLLVSAPLAQAGVRLHCELQESTPQAAIFATYMGTTFTVDLGLQRVAELGGGVMREARVVSHKVGSCLGVAKRLVAGVEVTTNREDLSGFCREGKVSLTIDESLRGYVRIAVQAKGVNLAADSAYICE